MAPFIVAINAISGGGKTTITKELQKRLSFSRALYFDDRDYDSESGIEDICNWIEDGADVNLFNLELLAGDIKKLLKENLDFIIIDYPFGYRHKQIAPYINYSIFIDTPLDVALARRIIRDYSQETASAILADVKQYLERGRDAYIYGLESVKASADLLVDGNMTIDKIADCISEKVKSAKKLTSPNKDIAILVSKENARQVKYREII